MALEIYRSINIQPARRAVIDQCNTIILEYQKQNLTLTLRQLYYQGVSRGLWVNTVRSYKNLGSTVSDARLTGLMDWDAIEDRGRQPRKAAEYTDLSDLAEAAAYSYRLPRWHNQEKYVELWVEKEALSGVLDPVAREFHAVLMVNKGYASQSSMYESAKRFMVGQNASLPLPKEAVLLYLGDHDPSGEDMVRDVRERLAMFGVEDLEVRKLALTMDQIEQYNPPPNPAKTTDSRSEAYIAEHGESSWEVDALPPDVLQALIREAFEDLVDQDKVDAIKAHEEVERGQLRKVMSDHVSKKGKPNLDKIVKAHLKKIGRDEE